jgi:hypothetical protein
LFLAPVFSLKNCQQKSIRLALILPFILTVLSFVFYAVKFGIERDYRFEATTITINWVMIIVIGILIGVYIKQRLNKKVLNQKNC